MCVKQKNSLLETSLQQHVSARFKVWLYKVIQDRVFTICKHSNCDKIKISVLVTLHT
jgi:glucose-6-phosphate-specific signal transduction histidine kinase